MSHELSVAVVSFNTRALTLQCLAATEAAAAGWDAAFTLVDNGSSDGTVDAVRRERPGWRVLVLAENPGYGAALNRALRMAPGRFCLALNADVALHADAPHRLRAVLESRPECGLAGPALVYPDGRPQPSARRFPALAGALAELAGGPAVVPTRVWERWFYYGDRDLTRDALVDTVSGAVMMLRGEAFEKVGGFDEGFRMYFEETDLCRRLHDAGLAVAFCPEARAVHQRAASTLQTSVRLVEYYVSLIRYFRKHHGRGPASILTAAVALSTVARMAALILRYPPLDRRRAALLSTKEAACAHLLRRLWPSAAARA